MGNLESTSGADMERLFLINGMGTLNCMRATMFRMEAVGGCVLSI